LAAGVSHWRFGRFDIYPVNPPLVRLLAAAPVVYSGASGRWRDLRPAPGRWLAWRIDAEIAPRNARQIFFLHALARWACIPLALVGAGVCLTWARELYGRGAGTVALLLWCFDPTLLAHAQLITCDVGAAALGIAAAYAFWHWLRAPSWTAAAIAGLVLGLAELTKTTWLLLFALWPAIWLAWRLPVRRLSLSAFGGARSARPTLRTEVGGFRGVRNAPAQQRCSAAGAQMVLILALGLLVVNAGYGFEGSFQLLGDYRFASRTLAGETDLSGHGPPVANRFADTWLAAIPVPLPESYILGIDLLKSGFEGKMPSYLAGQWRPRGCWCYCLYALAVKLPLGTWVLLSLALGVTLFRRGYSATRRDELTLIAPAVAVLVLVSSQTGLNHHLRYVIPAFPFAIIWTSKIARAFDLNDRKLAHLAGAALVWSIGSSLWIYPHNLSYFNELAGGPRGGPEYLLGSNVDWGQDLLYLKRWQDAHAGARPLGLAYCGPAIDPRVAGIDYIEAPPGPKTAGKDAVPPDRAGPLPGWYAISVNKLRGLGTKYAYFLHFKPAAMAGYSIYIYHITLDDANRVRRELGLPELTGEFRSERKSET
jgi:hypothetical protein